MRSGRLLAEESPQALLTMYRCNNLEDVFLKLSRKQGTSNEVSELNIRYGVTSHFDEIFNSIFRIFSFRSVTCH